MKAALILAELMVFLVLLPQAGRSVDALPLVSQLLWLCWWVQTAKALKFLA